MPDEPTQPTQPKKPGAEPVQVPVPTREAFLRDMAKLAPPAKPDDEKKGS